MDWAFGIGTSRMCGWSLDGRDLAGDVVGGVARRRDILSRAEQPVQLDSTVVLRSFFHSPISPSAPIHPHVAVNLACSPTHPRRTPRCWRPQGLARLVVCTGVRGGAERYNEA